jgi:DNA-binding XRE family transcriptional regulator
VDPQFREGVDLFLDSQSAKESKKESRIYAADLKGCSLPLSGVDSREIFGRNLARIRAKAALTQEQLAEKADIDRSQVQRIENGTSSPTVETATRLKRSLLCSWKELLAGLD